MPAFSARLGRVTTAATTTQTMRARALRDAGHDVIQLTIGEPNFDTPRHAIDAAYQAALAGQTKYAPSEGTQELKLAIQAKFRRERGLDYGMDQITVSNGGKQALFNAIMATVDAGAEVVIPSPYWGAYPLMTKLAGGVPVTVACPENNGFKLRPEDLDAAITPNTRMLMLNFPNNPSGAACSRAELEAIAEVMRRHPHVWIVSDDMYEHLIYDGFEYTTLAQVAPDLRERIVIISGVSKSYAMTGWRIGFAVGARELIAAMTNLQGQASAGASMVNQAAAAAALNGPQTVVEEMTTIYRRRRDLCVAALNAMNGVTCHKPEGAFYVFPNIAGCIGRTTAGGRRIATDRDFAAALLDEAYVALVHGGAFGMSPYLRISYATDDESLERAMVRMAEFVAGLH